MDLCLSKHLKFLRAAGYFRLHILRDSLRYIALPIWGSHLQWERCYSGGSSLIMYQPIFLGFQSPASAWSSTLGVVSKEKKQRQDTWQERRCWDSPVILPSVSYGFLIFVLICFILFWCFVCLLALEYSLSFPKTMYCDFGLICLFTAYTVFKSMNITCGQLTFFR